VSRLARGAGVKQAVQQLGRRLGVEVKRSRPRTDKMGIDAFADIRRLLSDVSRPVVFDVGANVGQSVERLSALLPGCELYAFEPSPAVYRELERNTRRIRNVTLVNAGVGAVPGTELLLENAHSDMSSFLAPGPATWSTVVRRTPVDVTTLTSYCREHDISRIDLLKIDTQGYDLEVLEGAVELLKAKMVRLIYAEVVFADLYEGQPSFEDIKRFLDQHAFQLVGIYNFVAWKGVAGWCDVLYKSGSPDFH
jgi:FkbM family methyltransferase